MKVCGDTGIPLHTRTAHPLPLQGGSLQLLRLFCDFSGQPSCPPLLTHLSRRQAVPRTTPAALTVANNSEFILCRLWSWFVRGQEMAQRSGSAKHPLARYCSFDFREAPCWLFTKS